jgi:hypothetical protein
MRRFEYCLTPEVAERLFDEVRRIRADYPTECLNDGLWSDQSERANGVTRDAAGVLCLTVGLIREDGAWEEYYSLRENSSVWLGSTLHQVLSELIVPHETLIEPNPAGG